MTRTATTPTEHPTAMPMTAPSERPSDAAAEVDGGGDGAAMGVPEVVPVVIMGASITLSLTRQAASTLSQNHGGGALHIARVWRVHCAAQDVRLHTITAIARGQ